MALLIFLRGGGDLASGVALRLYHAGFKIIITELPEPLVVRRAVSFAEAVYSGKTKVEGVPGCLAHDLNQAWEFLRVGCIPVMIDPQAKMLEEARNRLPAQSPIVLIDARMTKTRTQGNPDTVELAIGLGPGFVASENCDAVIETNRGHRMGRVIWRGAAEKDTGVPESVRAHGTDRVIRSPVNGILAAHVQIGDHLEEGQIIAEVGDMQVKAPFKGVLRGLLHPGIHVWRGLKLGDIDPRDDPRYCYQVSDKSLAIGGGVLEAILSRVELRPRLWD
jgi:xanthine dehydrogenase accessory factor